ncbi:bifunctional GNAT family N-acetyltransferase/(deoxy)nucleoside triphosphate pyrophosphohydrolase [Rhodopila sp.]|uniref:bifunctional GNAT family N-acetyltransferase/(deoxy)nucleoside triphosphate pyrophosphohydrolase n=1 Tax=Rhodopila sp. TaxID=2480087 RepID=UPI003D0EB90D
MREPSGLRHLGQRLADKVNPIPATTQAKPKRKPRRSAKTPASAIAQAASQASAPPDPAPHDPAPPEAFTPLTTERLTLRPLHANDAEALHRLINDWEVTRTLAELPYPYPRELADDWIASTIRRLAEGSAYHLAITGHDGERETLVGVVGLTLDQPNRAGRLGYWVGRAYWKHGVATEAATRLTRWAFANLTLDRIVAEVAEANDASCIVLRRIGFSQTGTATRRSKISDQDHQVLVFQATRNDIFGWTEVPKDAGSAADPGADPGAKPLLLVAACALVDLDGRVLLARRPEGKKMAGLWEFPGGKLNPGETPEAGLIRELKEEIGIDVTAACLAPFAFASHTYEGFHLLMPLFVCRRWKGIPRPRENQTLAWVRAAKLTEYEMPPADKPLIPLLRDFL